MVCVSEVLRACPSGKMLCYRPRISLSPGVLSPSITWYFPGRTFSSFQTGQWGCKLVFSKYQSSPHQEFCRLPYTVHNVLQRNSLIVHVPSSQRQFHATTAGKPVCYREKAAHKCSRNEMSPNISLPSVLPLFVKTGIKASTKEVFL